jgi:hypothetical protein
MMTLIALVTLVSAWVIGLTIASQEGMILHRLQSWAEKKEEEGGWWAKPIITCPSCMPSIHAVFGYIFGWLVGCDISFKMILAYPIVVVFSSAVITFLWTIYLWIDIQIPYYRNVERLTYFDVKDRKDAFIKRGNRNQTALNNHNS